MKKGLMCFVSIVCVIAMLVSMGSVSFAQETEYKSTQHFLDYMDELGIPYNYYGIDDDNWEAVSVIFGPSISSSFECFIYFEQNNHEVEFRIWDLVKPSAGENFTLSTINELNANWKYAKFVLNERDSTVQAEMDMYIDGDHCARSVYDAMDSLLDIIEDEYTSQALRKLE